MIMKDPEALGFDPARYVIWDWNYWDTVAIPECVNLHALGSYSRAEIGKSAVAREFPEILDKQGEPRAFGSVQVLKKHGYEVILCSASRSHGDTFYCPVPLHAANIAGAAKAVASEKLLGHCVTSWAIRLNDYLTQVPYIGLASYARSRPKESSDALLYAYCQTLFGAPPGKFIQAINLLGIRMLPFATCAMNAVQWNSLKDSLPAPEEYLVTYLANLKKIDPARFDSLAATLDKAVVDIPEGIRLMAEFFTEAKKGLDILEAWLTGARFLLATALVGQRILKQEKGPELALILEQTRSDYEAFLRRREDPQSAAKNAGLVYDALIEFFWR